MQFEDADLTQVLGTLALAVILAEGGFTTRLGVVRPVAPLAGLLATVGVAVERRRDDGRWCYLAAGRRPAHRDPARAPSRPRPTRRRCSPYCAGCRIRGRLRRRVEAESGFNDPPVIILVTVADLERLGRRRRARRSLGSWSCYQLARRVSWSACWSRGPARGCWLRSALPASGPVSDRHPRRSRSSPSRSPASLGASALLAIYVAGLVLGNARAPAPRRDRRLRRGPGLAGPDRPVHHARPAGQPRPTGLDASALRAGRRAGAAALVARPLSVMRLCTPFRVPWRDQAFMSLGRAARRGADRARDHPDERRSARRAPDLRRRLPARRACSPWSRARPCRGWPAGSAPRSTSNTAGDRRSSPRRSTTSTRPCSSSRCTGSSRLVGVEVTELRLPAWRRGVAGATRGDEVFAPAPSTRAPRR